MLKIATFPICLILMQIFAIFGLIFPHHARVVISKIQILWGYDNILHRVALANGHSPRWIHSSLIFSVAPCFHSIEDFNKFNLYMYMVDFHPRETRSLLILFSETFRDNRELFTEDDYTRFIKILADIKGVIRRLSPYSRNEVTEINEVTVIKNARLEDLIAGISDELQTFNTEERSAGEQLLQAIKDTLKNESICAVKIQAIKEFKREIGKEKLTQILKDQITRTKLSLRREYIREWIEHGHRRLHQYIDGQINLEELKRCLTFEDSALNFKRIFPQPN